MKKDHPQGNIDLFQDGLIYGWAVCSKLLEENICDLFIDGVYISTFLAHEYRADIKARSLRNGVAGFKAAVPVYYCDGNKHTVEIFKHSTKIKLHAKELTLNNIPTFKNLSESIVFNTINNEYTNQKPIVLLAGFSNQKKLLIYQKHLVKSFQEAGLYVVYIITSDFPEKLSNELTNADHIIIRQNKNYDFGSWATAWLCCQKILYETENIFFVNDSIIGPLGSINPLLEKIDKEKCNIWAITDSQEKNYHFQSFFWGIKKKTKQFFPIIDEFFFYRHPLPSNKDEAINLYEIKALNFFIDSKLTVNILFPEHTLIDMAEEEFLVDLNLHIEKWAVFFNLPFQKEVFSQIQGGLISYSDVLMNRLITNSSHVFWNILIKQGFPFIKKELITLNPANYPFPKKIRALFKESKMEILLKDLPYINEFKRNI